MAQNKKMNFIRKFYNRKEYTNFIDNSFKELAAPTPQKRPGENVFIDPNEQLNQFFQLYDKLFYIIPEVGDSKSHEYLVKTSGNLVTLNNEVNDSIIQLQAEIGALREDLLESQKQELLLQTENSELKATLNIT